jgi:hypothetical protein
MMLSDTLDDDKALSGIKYRLKKAVYDWYSNWGVHDGWRHLQQRIFDYLRNHSIPSLSRGWDTYSKSLGSIPYLQYLPPFLTR